MKRNYYNKFITLNYILDNRKKFTFIWTTFLFTPFISVFVGVPLPFPFHAFEISENMARLIETISYTLAIIGTISAGVYTIKKNNDDRIKGQNERIDNIKTELCMQIESSFKDLESRIMESQKHQDVMNDSKMANIIVQINNLKDSDIELKKSFGVIEDRVYKLRMGTSQEGKD